MFLAGAILLAKGMGYGTSSRRDKVKMAGVQRASLWKRIGSEAGKVGMQINVHLTLSCTL